MASMENARPIGQSQRSNSEQLLRASTFGTEADLSLGTTRSTSFPFIPEGERENVFNPITKDADLGGMANSRYQSNFPHPFYALLLGNKVSQHGMNRIVLFRVGEIFWTTFLIARSKR